MKKKVIAWSSLPASMPVNMTIYSYLLLDRWNASQWVWGVVATLIVFIWLACIYSMLTSEYVDVFNQN